MPRLWVANVEEVFAPRAAADDTWILPKLEAMAPRFLFHPEPGDALLVSHPVDADFRRYARRVGGFGDRPLEVFVPERRPSPYFLVDAALADARLASRLRSLTGVDGWRIEPYFESTRTHRLGEVLGIPGGRSPAHVVEEGLIARLNDKWTFKRTAQGMGIPVIPGAVGEGLEEVRRQTFRIPVGPDGCLMLRRSLSGGGLGNLAGSPDDLRERLPGWYRPGRVLVETCMSFTGTAGTVAVLDDDGCRFQGADQQVFDRGCWVGFRAPLADETLLDRVRRETLRLAARFQAEGARGFLNVDWGLVDRGGWTEAVAIEANFRHNGLSHILDWAERTLRGGVGDKTILFLETCPVDLERFSAVPVFLAALGEVQVGGKGVLLTGRGADRGLVPILPPRSDPALSDFATPGRTGRCGLAIFGPDPIWVEEVWAQVRRTLTEPDVG